MHLCVIIPAHNSEETIQQCLGAVRMSAYKEYELIVVDDASCDRTASLASRYADKVITLPERKGRNYARQRGLDVRVVRIFNTYGKRMQPYDGRVMPAFIKAAKQNQDLEIYGDGSQTRSFCYIDDLVEGIIKVMEGDYQKPVNLGNPQETTIKSLAEMIISLTGSKSKIVYLEKREDDPSRRCPDITLAQTKYGWSPKVGLEEGLKKTMDL